MVVPEIGKYWPQQYRYGRVGSKESLWKSSVKYNITSAMKIENLMISWLFQLIHGILSQQSVQYVHSQTNHVITNYSDVTSLMPCEAWWHLYVSPWVQVMASCNYVNQWRLNFNWTWTKKLDFDLSQNKMGNCYLRKCIWYVICKMWHFGCMLYIFRVCHIKTFLSLFCNVYIYIYIYIYIYAGCWQLQIEF